MAQTANADGPVVFFTKAGAQITIPVSAISFDDAGVVQVDRPADADTPQLLAWLAYLVDQQRITRTATPPPGPAMNLTALHPGTIGDGITVEVRALPDRTKVKVIITWITEYAGLGLGDLARVLGDTGTPLPQPALVMLQNLPAGGPDPIDTTAIAATAGKWELPGTAGVAFTLAPTPGTDASKVKVEVRDVAGAPGAKTFELVATWQLEKDCTAAQLGDLATEAASLVTITPPAGGYQLPKVGTVTLGGGAEAAPARAATAIVLASS